MLHPTTARMGVDEFLAWAPTVSRTASTSGSCAHRGASTSTDERVRWFRAESHRANHLGALGLVA